MTSISSDQEASLSSHQLPEAEPIAVARPVIVGRVVVMTLALMTALIIYDGWNKLRFVDVAAIIIGPLLAIFASHLFGSTLAARVKLGRTLSGPERKTLLLTESRFLLVAVPPLTLLAVLAAFGVAYTRIIHVIVLLGIASLGFWAGFAGRIAGLTGWRLTLCVAYGLGMGGLTLVLQAILQPGTDPFHP